MPTEIEITLKIEGEFLVLHKFQAEYVILEIQRYKPFYSTLNN